MWGLRDLRHARVKKSPLWICLILLGPTTANIVQNLVSLQDQGIAVPQLTAGLVEAIPCEWYNYFISNSVYDNTLRVLHLKWDLGGDYGVPKLSKVTPFWVLHCYTDRRRVPKLSKRRPGWGERRATQKVEWAIQSWRTAGKKLDKHGFATHRTRACARVWQHHTLHFYNPIVLN